MNNQAMPPKKKHRFLRISLFVLLNAAIIAYTAYSEYNKGGKNAQNFFTIRIAWIFLLPALLCFAVMILSEIFKYCIIVKKLCGKHMFKTAYEVCMLGKYYDYITPSGIGGQPYQIYYLQKNGINPGAAVVIPAAGFLSSQFMFVIVALFVFIFNSSVITSVGIRIAAYAGLVLYMLFPTYIVIFTFAPTFSKKFITWLINVGYRLKLVKNRENTQNSWLSTLEEYRVGILSLIKRTDLVLLTMLLTLVYYAALFSLPYYIILAFGGNISFIASFCTTCFVYASITFIPTPGNAGAAEGSFYTLFSMLTPGHIFWAMLVWRFLCYYCYIIWGVGIYAVKFFDESKKLRNAKCAYTQVQSEKEESVNGK